MYRKTYVEVNVDNIQNNIKNILKEYPNYKYYIGVVKGNCYGHGAYLSKYIVESGINFLAVSTLEEAIEVRKYVDTPMLCLEPIEIEYLDKAKELNLSITVSSMDYYKELISSNIKGLKVHLKLNTGMNRIGLNNKEQVEEIYNNLINNEDIKLEGIYTHFSTTGIQDTIYDYQLNKFVELTKNIDLKKIEMVHLGRSCNLELHPKIEFANGIRLGIVMYGISQSFNRYEGLKGKLRKIKHNYIVKKNNISKVYESSNLNVKTGFKLKTKIMEINDVKKEQRVGYGGTYKLKHDERIAICPIGYADGLTLNHKNLIPTINDKQYKIVGTIMMGMIAIKVDGIVKHNDEVVLIGNNIKQEASLVHTNPYILMTSINSNVPRVYIKDNKVIKEI